MHSLRGFEFFISYLFTNGACAVHVSFSMTTAAACVAHSQLVKRYVRKWQASRETVGSTVGDTTDK